MTPPWDPPFEALLRSALTLLEPHDSLDPDLGMAKWGLDSLATVELMLNVEDTYGICIPDELVGPELFATPQILWNAVSSLRAAESSCPYELVRDRG
ncbi:phosphopantetheine-binding protein [Streptomyces sp. NPDC088251]|uniref:phosphopantetheine-binding protein n=1 Tax=unclassified Streptomyces TaxID=2593676 RepID=UPI0038252A50